MPDKLVIRPEEDGKSLGEVLRKRGFSRRLRCRLKRTEGGMSRDGELIRTVDKVFEGEEIDLAPEEIPTLEASTDIPDVPVLYEDREVVVFDKPAGMPVHPSIKHQGDTLGNYFAKRYKGLPFRPVNRLDRCTSGCVIVAKSQFSAAALQGRFGKKYLAVCCGDPGETGKIDAPIARAEDSIITRCVREDGKEASTLFRRLRTGEKYSLCEVTPLTGRTHQIRVHFAHIGFPLAGDSLYGGSTEDIGRQALHCISVSFVSPDDDENHIISSPLPADMESLIP